MSVETISLVLGELEGDAGKSPTRLLEFFQEHLQPLLDDVDELQPRDVRRLAAQLLWSSSARHPAAAAETRAQLVLLAEEFPNAVARVAADLRSTTPRTAIFFLKCACDGKWSQ